jgi:hypothetical protein
MTPTVSENSFLQLQLVKCTLYRKGNQIKFTNIKQIIFHLKQTQRFMYDGVSKSFRTES